jgi:tellurite resistance protein TehA-like permease
MQIALKINFFIMLLLGASIFIYASPVANAAKPAVTSSGTQTLSAAQQACDSQGSAKSACVAGYNGGNSGKDKGDTCKSYSGSKKTACQKGYEAGSTAKNAATAGNAASSAANNVSCPPGLQGGCADPSLSGNCDQQGCDLIQKYVNPTILVLSGIFGLIAAGSIIMGAIMFITSEGDPQKSAKAKDRIAKTVFAIFIYAFMYSFLQFLIPGGVFNR